MNMNYEDEPAPRTKKTSDPFALAAGLLKNDLRLIPLLLLLLSLSGVAQTLQSSSNFSDVLGLQLVERFVQLAVLVFVIVRWRKKLAREGHSSVHPLAVGSRVMLVGFLVWGALMSPTFLLLFSTNPAISLPLSIFFIVGVFWWFRFYFYFLVYGILGTSLRMGISQTLELGRRSPTAAVRSLVAPVALTSLIVWLVALPSPDGRSVEWAAAGAAAQGIFWLLSIYTGLGLGLLLLDDQEWRGAKLDAYRKERLETLEAQGRASFLNFLSPASGVKMFVLAVVVMVFNLFQALHTPPAAAIKLVSWSAQDQILRVALELKDPEYHFRGFNPVAFSIASQTGYGISTELVRIGRSPEGKRGEREFEVTEDEKKGAVTLYLEFATNKRDDVLRSLDNMWLWYNQVSIAPLRIEDGRAI
jgi:hypothetical protein